MVTEPVDWPQFALVLLVTVAVIADGCVMVAGTVAVQPLESVMVKV
jgi:hypothetical protein